MKRRKPGLEALRDVGEFGFIDRVMKRFGGPVRPGEVGIGDDAALLPAPKGRLALSADLLVEGTHFDTGYFLPREIGWRALSANVSDLAAVGAKPLWYLAAVAAPPETPVETLMGIFDGMARAAKSSGIRLMGGDTCRGDRIVLSLTVAGKVAGAAGGTLRRGARPGDILFVTGEPGWSALGLELLRKGRPRVPSSWQKQAMRRHLTPVARWKEGISAGRSGAVAAMIDVSDGILADLAHLLEGERIGAALDEKAFRLTPLFRRAGAALGVDPAAAFLAGGEDYELLMAVRPHAYEAFRRAARAFPAGAFPIGVVTARPGIFVRDAGGRWKGPGELPAGFDHFRAPAPGRTRSRRT